MCRKKIQHIAVTLKMIEKSQKVKVVNISKLDISTLSKLILKAFSNV